MRLKMSIASAAGAAGLVASLGYANAAPPVVALQAAAPAISRVATHCWHSEGMRHCRSFDRFYGYGRGYREYNNPEAYRTGSSRRWQEMDRLDRGGRRP